jgi:hypothetical protein
MKSRVEALQKKKSKGEPGIPLRYKDYVPEGNEEQNLLAFLSEYGYPRGIVRDDSKELGAPDSILFNGYEDKARFLLPKIHQHGIPFAKVAPYLFSVLEKRTGLTSWKDTPPNDPYLLKTNPGTLMYSVSDTLMERLEIIEGVLDVYAQGVADGTIDERDFEELKTNVGIVEFGNLVQMLQQHYEKYRPEFFHYFITIPGTTRSSRN